MKKLFCLILALLFILTSCGKAAPSPPICLKIIEKLCKEEKNLPAGKIYYSSAAEGQDGYISKTLLSSLLGNGKQLEIFELWDDYAFFLPSGDAACEFIVIHCIDKSNLQSTALLLFSRLTALESSKGDKYKDYFEIREILTIKNYAVMIVSSDVKNSRKTVQKLISKSS